ncbi:MAG: SAM-dependent methyltransferase, partial [Pygmaiobacter sp.]
VPVPAASAAVTALAVSGQPSGRWCFEGFLPMNKRQRRERLAQTCTEQRTMIFYEAPHKLPATLTDLLAAFGDRSMTICRELTKLHEQIWKTTLAQAADFYSTNAPRGEFVLVIAGAQPVPPKELTLEDAVELAQELIESGLAASAACREAAAKTGVTKSEIYRAVSCKD